MNFYNAPANSSTALRQVIVSLAAKAGTGHISSALSMADILSVLFFETMSFHDGRLKDHFVLSKGHGSLGLYSVLYLKGLLKKEDLLDYHKNGSKMTTFPGEPFFNGLDFSSGSLGHGPGVACGLAIAARNDKTEKNIYCLMSDGECQEGSIWEAALFAGHHQLSNLHFIIDFNRLQAIAPIKDVLNLENLAEKWVSFGWDAEYVDGHDRTSLMKALSKKSVSKPRILIAKTVKGKGVSFMENSIKWHYLPIKDEFRDLAFKELGL
jgi:transketolase